MLEKPFTSANADPAEAAAERRHFLVLLFACLAGLAGLQLLEPFFFLHDDNATQYLSHFTHAYNSVALEHTLPLLNQHQSLGGTFLASGHTGVFLVALYPLAWLSRLLIGDFRLLIDLLASLDLLLAGLGMWRLLRGRGLPRELALPLALCWTFSPFAVVIGRSWVVATYVVAYLPWNFHFLLRFLERPSARRALAVVVVKSLFLFAGYLNHVAFAFFFEGVFFLLRWWRLRREPGLWPEVRRIAALSLLPLLISAPLLLPAWQAVEVSAFRATPMKLSQVLKFALPPGDFLAAQIPWTRDSAPFETSTAIYFVGWPLLAFLPAAARRRENGATPLPWLATGLLGLLFSTRCYLFLAFLPVFSTLRWPFKILPIAIFFLMLAAAAGAQALATDSRRTRLVRAAIWGTLALQAGLLAWPANRQPFSSIRLDASPATVRDSPFFRLIGEDWRMMAVSAEGESKIEQPLYNASYDYATQLGKYHVSGYDPMVSRINFILGLRGDVEADLILKPEGWPQARRMLEISSARYVVVEETSRLRPLIEKDNAARRLASANGLALFELARAMPIVYSISERRPLPFRWRTNGLDIEVPDDFAGGDVLVNVAALDGYQWWRDGEPQGTPNNNDNRLLLKVEKGAARIVVRYRDEAFFRGLVLSLAGLLLLALGLRRGFA